ncbi:MAG: tetratricopeptide repeat protein [Bacteroidales bacterium]|jgi:tetratricopeptide (TPR) repeat protein|nr:tetratricopeptide repeat protein [Bacteroidales bacterium]
MENDSRIKEQLAETYFKEGNTAFSNNDCEKAIDCYKRAVTCKPDLAYAYVNMGGAYYHWNKQYEKAIECYQKAIECWEKAIEHKLDLSMAYYNMGAAYLKTGDNEQAIASMKQAAQLGHESAKNWLKENGIE